MREGGSPGTSSDHPGLHILLPLWYRPAPINQYSSACKAFQEVLLAEDGDFWLAAAPSFVAMQVLLRMGKLISVNTYRLKYEPVLEQNSGNKIVGSQSDYFIRRPSPLCEARASCKEPLLHGLTSVQLVTFAEGEGLRYDH